MEREEEALRGRQEQIMEEMEKHIFDTEGTLNEREGGGGGARGGGRKITNKKSMPGGAG